MRNRADGARAHCASPAILTARGLAVLLWVLGSIILVGAEFDLPKPNMIVAGTIPPLWAAIIALPVLAHYALADRQWTASVLLILAGCIGSLYMLSGTIGRQSEARDTRVERAHEAAQRRDDLSGKIATNEAQLVEARKQLAAECATGAGKRCEGVKIVVGLYETALGAQRDELSRIESAAPDAGEKRIAAIIALWSERPIAELERAVGLVQPLLLGLAIEVAALACAMFGWSPHPTCKASLQVQHPNSQSDYPVVSDDEAARLAPLFVPDGSGRSGGLSIEPAPIKPRLGGPDGWRNEVLGFLLTDLPLGRSATSQRDLCERFGVARSTMSDWLSEWERSGLIPARRMVGRCKAIGAA